MDDDIDIEEHDVLDNPIIRKMFPDISVIKEEISKYYEDVKQEPEITTTTDKLLEEPVIHRKEDESVKQINEQSSTNNHASRVTVDIPISKDNKRKRPYESTKIILGSNSESQNNTWKKSFQGSKIILGSKPNKTVKQTQAKEINQGQNISLESVVRIPKLLLQDLGEYIFQSNRYCEDCKTLFPSKPDLQDHKTKSHVLKTQNKQANVKVTLKRASADKRNKCKICRSYFSHRSALNRHYRNIHKIKVLPNKDDPIKNASCIASIDDTKRTINKHNLIDRKSYENAIRTRNKHLNVKVILEETKSKKKVTKPQNKVQAKQHAILNKSKCTICGSYFSNRANLNRHYKNVHKMKVSVKLTNKNDVLLDRANNSSRIVSINKSTRSQSLNAKSDAKNVCFHCNKQFFDQKCLIEHIYSILEPKQDRKLSKTLQIDEEKYTTEKINIELSNAKTQGIRMKDKLIFENQDSDESESLSSETEKIKKYDSETALKSKNKHTISSYIEKERNEINSDDESVSLDNSSPNPVRDKRKHDFSDDDAKSMEWSDLDTNETNENLASHDSNSLNKNRKHETEHINSNSTDSTSKKSKKSKRNLSNKHKTLKTKTVKPKNRLLTMVSKNHIVGLQPSNVIGKNLKDLFVYECIYCSFILPSSRSYCMHLFWKHKLENVTRVNKVKFDRQCKYCPCRNSQRNHNRHIRMCHYDLLTKPHNDEVEDCLRKKEAKRLKNPAFKKVESFVLKSIVYKCSKCDVHFLSSCVAKDHEKHMELLINWKCSVCKKIFKKRDKHLHLKQHTFSKTVNVCQFDQSELSRLLYNCTKCAIHFTEERYLEHYSKCGNQTTDSVYCKNCDILIDKCGYDDHEACHRTVQNTEDIIVITGDIITNSQGKATIQEEKDEIETVQNEARIYSPINCLTFCETCQCYLSDIAINRKSHVEARCSKMVKYTCPTCGLVFTNKTINTHRDHHKKEKGLKLQDFEFFDLKGIQIRPPIPKYPSCNNCKVTFVGRNAVKSHICSETEYLTCEICNVKLSESAFQLHMNFHSYCMPNEKVHQKLYAVPGKLKQKHIGLEKHVKILNINVCEALPNTHIAETESHEHSIKMHEDATTSSAQLCNTALKEKRNNAQTVTATEMSPNKQSPCISTSIEIENEDLTDNNARSNILYACQSCNISVDTYDKVIQHCQNHFSPNPAISSSLKICSKCSLKFEIDTYEIHKKKKLNCDMVKVLTFDPTYFTSENNIWTRHIFASVDPSVQEEAVENSVYQHECRIKMEIVQQGPSYLTVYKCYKCGIFIDPDCLVSHIKEGCHKNVGKHPCSVCGLPFVSSLSRTKHEKIHRRHNNVRLKSYNILLINSHSHISYNASILNAMKQYVLYQCKTCDGIVDKSQRIDHKCNVDDLRQCKSCGLLLYKDDFDRHITKHSDLDTYNTDKIKVILFGNNEESIPNKALSSNFKGVVSDYKLYKCIKCEECENDDKLVSRHVCTLDDSKWKCPKCGNYISARSIKQHIKKHDVDAEFKTDNFIVINFDKSKDNGLDKTKETNCGNNNSKESNKLESDSKEHAIAELEKDCVQLDHNTTNNSENSSNNGQEKEYTLYKCACGLHYMDEMIANNHAKHCCPKMKIIRQNCSKCSLTFNPKELFSHILAHHGDKNKTFKYNVIEVKAK